MATNLLQPTGLQLNRNALGLAPNYQGKLYQILTGYGSNIGKGDIVQLKDEGYGTADGSFSAHFEHTVAITEKGPRILTKV